MSLYLSGMHSKEWEGVRLAKECQEGCEVWRAREKVEIVQGIDLRVDRVSSWKVRETNVWFSF